MRLTIREIKIWKLGDANNGKQQPVDRQRTVEVDSFGGVDWSKEHEQLRTKCEYEENRSTPALLQERQYKHLAVEHRQTPSPLHDRHLHDAHRLEVALQYPSLLARLLHQLDVLCLRLVHYLVPTWRSRHASHGQLYVVYIGYSWLRWCYTFLHRDPADYWLWCAVYYGEVSRGYFCYDDSVECWCYDSIVYGKPFLQFINILV